jgi:hypothetical protein
MDEQNHGYLEAAFRRINKNIDKLFGMKDEKKGVWIFKSHKYSAKQLFSSYEYDKIESISEKIADDISNWRENGQLDIETKRIYNVNRDYLVARTEELAKAIEDRQPTWWGKVKNFFAQLLDFISRILPRLVLNILLKMVSMPGLLGHIGKGLLTVNSGMNKLLTAQENIYITDGEDDKWKEVTEIKQVAGIWEGPVLDEDDNALAYRRLEIHPNGAIYTGKTIAMAKTVKKTAVDSNISEDIIWKQLIDELLKKNKDVIECGKYRICILEETSYEIDLSNMYLNKRGTQLKITYEDEIVYTKKKEKYTISTDYETHSKLHTSQKYFYMGG